MSRSKSSVIILAVALVLVIGVSIVLGAFFFTKPEIYRHQINKLDEKKETVTTLMATSATASAAITILPGDIATPVADKLADISGYFLFVLGAIYAEKFALTLFGAISFYLLIPVSCFTMIIHLFWPKDFLRRAHKKLMLFALCLMLLIPASTYLSDMIDSTYHDSIQEAINSAYSAIDDAEKESNNNNKSNLWDKIKDAVDSVSVDAQKLFAKVKIVTTHLGDALVVMIVTSCLIPVLVLIVLATVLKILFNIDIPMPKPAKIVTNKPHDCLSPLSSDNDSKE